MTEEIKTENVVEVPTSAKMVKTHADLLFEWMARKPLWTKNSLEEFLNGAVAAGTLFDQDTITWADKKEILTRMYNARKVVA